jgi:hypothetical protein
MLKLGHDVSVHETLHGKVTSLTTSLLQLEKAGIVAREGKGRSALWRIDHRNRKRDDDTVREAKELPNTSAAQSKFLRRRRWF